MNAKDMFDRLEFKKKTYLDTRGYKIMEFHSSMDSISVIFYLQEKKYKADFLGFGAVVDMRLHNAIHQQLKELGWLDD